ncbi:MAG TPA: hypothetical protein VI039_11810 [Solirubrobacterales bacterium]
MPSRLRPTAPIAAAAILVGDPGRALMLAQALLQKPKMSNHARGLWGYTGVTHDGKELTIQSTGMGGPSASVVVADLAELGVQRAIRLGTCTSLGAPQLGDLVIVKEAHSSRGSFQTHGDRKEPRDPPALPDPALTAALGEAVGDGRLGSVLSLDTLYRPERDMPSVLADVADMQTAALFSTAAELGLIIAALLVVAEKSDSGQIRDDDLERMTKTAGVASAGLL